MPLSAWFASARRKSANSIQSDASPAKAGPGSLRTRHRHPDHASSSSFHFSVNSAQDAQSLLDAESPIGSACGSPPPPHLKNRKSRRVSLLQDEEKDIDASEDLAIAPSPSTTMAIQSDNRIISWATNEYRFTRDYTRLENRHRLCSLLLGRIHTAPIENPSNILDIATGTGIWAIEAHHRYPHARVIGLDKSSLQYTGPHVNRLRFLQGPIEPRLPFHDGEYDLIHALALSSTITDWPLFVAELHRITARNGWINLIEPSAEGVQCDDGSIPLASNMRRWFQICAYAASVSGVDCCAHLKIARYLEEAGFMNVQETIYKAYGHARDPGSEVEKTTALLVRRDMCEAVSSYGKEALEVLSNLNSDTAHKEFVKRVVEELRDPAIHWYIEYRSVIARRV